MFHSKFIFLLIFLIGLIISCGKLSNVRPIPESSEVDPQQNKEISHLKEQVKSLKHNSTTQKAHLVDQTSSLENQLKLIESLQDLSESFKAQVASLKTGVKIGEDKFAQRAQKTDSVIAALILDIKSQQEALNENLAYQQANDLNLTGISGHIEQLRGDLAQNASDFKEDLAKKASKVRLEAEVNRIDSLIRTTSETFTASIAGIQTTLTTLATSTDLADNVRLLNEAIDQKVSTKDLRASLTNVYKEIDARATITAMQEAQRTLQGDIDTRATQTSMNETVARLDRELANRVTLAKLRDDLGRLDETIKKLATLEKLASDLQLLRDAIEEKVSKQELDARLSSLDTTATGDTVNGTTP